MTTRPAITVILRVIAPAIICMCVWGCASGEGGGRRASAPLPTYLPMPAREALTIIADRIGSIRTISAPCDIELQDADGQTARLEGVLLAHPPEYFRLRAWKLGHAVFDVTVAGERTWLRRADGDANGSHAQLDTALDGANWREVFALLGPTYFRGANELSHRGTIDTLVVEGAGAGAGRLICNIDRATLLPRRFSSDDPHVILSVELGEYRSVSGIAWPMLVKATSPRGQFQLRLHDVELNIELPPGAFKPPRAARELGPERQGRPAP